MKDKDEILSELRSMDEYDFEYFVRDLWRLRGFKASVTQSSNDRGIDVIAEKEDPFYQKHLIQAKRYSENNRIGGPDIQQYSSLKHQEDNTDAVVIVTTGSFTSQARHRAKELNVKLVNYIGLYDLICDVDHSELLKRYPVLDESQEEGNTQTKPHLSEQSSKNVGSTDVHSGNITQGHPFDDYTLSRSEVVKSDFFGDRCPICSDRESVWEHKTSEGEKRLKCESCGTYWEAGGSSFPLSGQKVWIAMTGPEEGAEGTAEEWRNVK
jgi:ribosomal protein S27E